MMLEEREGSRLPRWIRRVRDSQRKAGLHVISHFAVISRGQWMVVVWLQGRQLNSSMAAPHPGW